MDLKTKNILAVMITGVISSVSFAADAGGKLLNPTNDPDGQFIEADVVKVLKVEGCKTLKSVAHVEPSAQTSTGFDIEAFGIDETDPDKKVVKHSSITGDYSWLNDSMYLNLDSTSKASVLADVKKNVGVFCPGTVLDERSFTVTKSQIKTFKNKSVIGLISVKVRFAKPVYVDFIYDKPITGMVSYDFKITGKLIRQ